MDKNVQIKWTQTALSDAISIKNGMGSKFTGRKLVAFEKSLKHLQCTLINFPTLYPKLKQQQQIRRAVIQKDTIVYYSLTHTMVTILAVQDKRKVIPK